MELLEKNFVYSSCVSKTYNTYYDCESYGCDTEGICRCGTIEDACIESVDVGRLGAEIYNLYFVDNSSVGSKRDNKIRHLLYGSNKEFDLYTIDRILRNVKIWEDDKWDIGVSGGYYGDEIEDIHLTKLVASKIDSLINDAFSLSFNERVEFLLKLEYGYLLERLEGLEFNLVSLDRAKVIFPNDEYYKNIKEEHYDHYTDINYKGIRGIAVLKDGVYKLVDGYHRMSSATSNTVSVIVGEKK